MENKMFLTSKEAAASMNISMPLFYQVAASEGFPVVRIGKKILVSVEGLREWEKTHRGCTIS